MNAEILCLAWREMRRLRTCPPVNVLKTDSPQVQRHLAACPDCRERLEQASPAAELGGVLAELSLPCPGAAPPAPGDLRRLRPTGKPGDWFDEDNEYHNPPLVLVLDNPDDQGVVRVAQVCDDPALQAEGDVLLENGTWGFAESWNIYAVPVSMLGKCPVYRFGRACAERVLEESHAVFPPIDMRSPLYHFRVCEAEIGSFFSLGAVLKALHETEARKSARIICFSSAVSQARRSSFEYLLDYAEGMAVAMAAAEAPLVRDDTADEHCRIRTAVAEEGKEPHLCAAEADVYRLTERAVVAVFCKVEDAPPSAEAAVSCGETPIRTVSVSRRRSDLLEISIELEDATCALDAMTVALMLPGDSDA